ncbi:hypothetical protein J7M23_09630 [Candidatus Sumerlaeota bacterium]|nr:hypothetical protein [Candidatus Sumerlaeota bacterium]
MRTRRIKVRYKGRGSIVIGGIAFSAQDPEKAVPPDILSKIHKFPALFEEVVEKIRPGNGGTNDEQTTK